MSKACKWHSPTPDPDCWACQRPRSEPICHECGQHLNACHERDELKARLAAAEAERDVERRDRTAAEFEMLADRELLRELYEHEINEYGRWTAGMCQRVCVAAKGERDEI